MRKDRLVTAGCLAAATAFTAAVWYLYYDNYFTGLLLNDAMDYAGIARNVARGQGFISQYVTPLSLAHHGVPQPDMWRAPLWPLFLAGFQLLFGFTDEASAIGTGFFFIAASPLVFLLARQWFGSLVAAGSVLVYTLTPELLRFSISGMTEPLAVFMMALTVLLVSAPGLKNRPGDWLAGLALGLFYLARYNALVFLPLFLLYRWLYRGEGFLPPLRMLVGFIVAALPWMARNTCIFGSPLFSLQKYEPVMFTSAFPDYSLYLRPIQFSVPEFIIDRPELLAEKVMAGWADFSGSFLSPEINGVTAAIFIIFLAALFLPMTPGAAGIRPLLAACYLAQLGALLVIHFIPRLFLVFAPFYIIFSLGALYALPGLASRNSEFRRLSGLLTAAAVILLSHSNYTDAAPPKKTAPEWLPYKEAINQLANAAPPNKVVVTNEGHFVSWYGDRYACKIPYSVDMVPEIKKRADVGALFISERILWATPEADRSWKHLWYRRPAELDGLGLAKSIPEGWFYYLPRK